MYRYGNNSKYKAKKTVIDGQKFDSRKEAARYQELCFLEKQGIIRNLQRQVKFVLIPSQRGKDGKVVERECSYYADFVYTLKNGEKIVEDVKGMKTEVYKLKRKMMRYFHGIEITEV